MKRALRTFGVALFIAMVVLHGLFLLRVVSWRWLDPDSTAYMRSEAARLLRERHQLLLEHEWVSYARINDSIKEAVIASEDSSFVDHEGVDWEAVQKAWESNHRGKRIKGGSTITQQLAKNLFFSGERNYLRKATELYVTYLLEWVLGKQRILEIYLNSVEWGEGIFGVQAAAQHYFHTSAERLTPWQAARLAVMLPRPRFYEKRWASSGYLVGRAGVIVRRMQLVDLP
ncbi:MAG: monofunctional biosynthetic peptidoglycan transglycosylase [Betaproteobacteria bacterium]|nr:monofunctional biosynthetic peptidoglycan transglycosylase [Betaproteobacteria bacterium]